MRITAVDVPEDIESALSSDPLALAAALAADKTLAAAAADTADVDSEPPRADLILGFDTVVVLGDVVLGKPRDVPDAWRMLHSLSGRTHQVITGVSLLDPIEGEPRTFAVTTNVRMQSLTDCRIEAWMAMGEFMGCAGAYNIEGQVAEVDADECYQNVAGLPLCHLWAALVEERRSCRWPGVPTVPVAICDAALRRQCTLGPRITSGAWADRP